MSKGLGLKKIESESIVYCLYRHLIEFENEKFRFLEGRLCTLVDAMFADPSQRKAWKDLIKQEIGQIWWGRQWELKPDWYAFKDLAEVIEDEHYETEISPHGITESQPPHQNIFK